MKRLVSGMIIVLVALITPANGSSQSSTDIGDFFNGTVPVRLRSVFEQAAVAFRSKQYDKAIAILTKGLETKPSSEIASYIYERRAACYTGAGKYKNAIADATEAIRLKPHGAAYNTRGVALSRVGEMQQAFNDYATAIRLNPTYAQAYYNRGCRYSDRGEHDKAIHDYTKAIQLYPNYADAYHNRGVEYAAIDSFQQAIADYNKALDLKINEPFDTYYGRADAYRRMADHDSAIRDYTQTIQLKPAPSTRLSAYWGRAKAYEQKGDRAKAITDYQQVVISEAKAAEDYSVRGAAHFDLGNYDAAVSDYSSALRISPTNQRVLDNFAWLRATCPKEPLRDGAKAVQMANKACELTKWRDGSCIDTLAGAYAELGDFDKAITYQEQALRTRGASSGGRKEMEQHLASYREHQPWREKALTE